MDGYYSCLHGHVGAVASGVGKNNGVTPVLGLVLASYFENLGHAWQRGMPSSQRRRPLPPPRRC